MSDTNVPDTGPAPERGGADAAPSAATGWDGRYRAAGEGRLWPDEPTIRWLNLGTWKRAGIRTVLDAGCGDGKNLATLVRAGFTSMGADLSPSALEKCEHYLREQGLAGGYELLPPTPLETLPIETASVDAALCIDVLGHLPQPGLVIGELARVVRPGGLIYASVFHPADECRTGPRMRLGDTADEFWYTPSVPDGREFYYRFYEREQVVELFSSTGLRVVSVEAHRWPEPPHQGYREEPHVHASWFVLAEKDGARRASDANH
jgi:SAM-dependent methyltransferase